MLFKTWRNGASNRGREDGPYGAYEEQGRTVPGVDRTYAEDQGAWPLNPPSSADAPFGEERFDELTVWCVMSSEEREALGRAAIASGVSRFGVEVARNEREERAMLAAGNRAVSEIELITDGLFRQDRIPGVPASLGKICRECGYSDYDVRDGGVGKPCGWTAENLCTSCARGEQGTEATTEPPPPATATPYRGSGTSGST